MVRYPDKRMATIEVRSVGTFPVKKWQPSPSHPQTMLNFGLKKKMKRKWVRLGSQQCLGKTKGWTQSRSINCHSESHVNPFIWWRYIDDIFMIWTRSVQDLNTIIPFLNNIHSTIKYTAMFSSGPYPMSTSRCQRLTSRWWQNRHWPLHQTYRQTPILIIHSSCHPIHTWVPKVQFFFSSFSVLV